MPNFTDKEVIVINAQKKLSAELPQYFNSATKTNTPISRDFEAYLILETQEHKQKSLSWIKDVQSISQDSTDRDAILKTFATNRLADANATIKELDSTLKNFDAFKAGLFNIGDSNDFASVFEVSLLAQSLQRPLDEIKFLRDRAFQEKVISNIQLDRLDRSGFNSDTQKELASWQTVISSYPGQSGSDQSSQQNTGSQQARGNDNGILDVGSKP